VNSSFFRKEALARYLRVDSPGAILTIVPPGAALALSVIVAVTLSLTALAILGKVQIVAEGHGIIRPDVAPVVITAPLTGTVSAVRNTIGEPGIAGEVLVEMDTHVEQAAYAACGPTIAANQKEVASLEAQLAGAGHDAAFALVLLSQLRTQRDKAADTVHRCDALASTIGAGHVVFPVDATVADLAVSPGSRVHEGDALATLDPKTAHLVGYIALPERHRNEVAQGQSVRLKFDALPFDEVGAGSARITRVLKTLPSHVKLDAADGTVFVEVSLDKMPSRGRAQSGMTFMGDILTERVRIIDLLGAASDDN
jgi:multidrug resistance efflux pump